MFNLVCYIIIALAIAGLVVVWKKPEVFIHRFGKQARPTIVMAVCLGVIVAAVLGMWWHRPAPKATVIKGPKDKQNVWEGIRQNLYKSPPGGPLHYNFATPQPAHQLLKGRISIITSEKSSNRIIELNDVLLQKLHDDGQISGNDQVFYLDYFDDKSVADTYFQKINDPKLSVKEKQTLLSHYIANMYYNAPLNLRFLTYLPDGKIVKRY